MALVPAAAQADDCANAAFRTSLATGLPDCRAFELVSPADKNGGDIPGDQVSFTAAKDGNAIAYASRGSFGDTVGTVAVGQSEYLARRGTNGWSSRGISPTPSYDADQIFAGGSPAVHFSDDLRRAVIWGFDLPAVTDSIPRTPNIYLEDTLTRDLQLVTKPLAGPVDHLTFILDFIFPEVIGVSRDTRHVAFKAISPLLAGAPAHVPSVYEWDDGTLRLASVLPNGEVAPDGALPGRSGFGNGYRETVSPDGSLVTFVSPPTPAGQLYARIDHSRTAWVSEPETIDPAPTPEQVVLQQVTGDSRHVIFATTSQLLDEDENDGSDLYLYTDSPNPETDSNLTLVSNTGDVPGDDLGTAVIGSSDDASRIYYFKGGRIVMWDEGVTKGVAFSIHYLEPRFHPSAMTSHPGGARVSQDGRYQAFWAARRIDSSGPHPVVGDSADTAQMYLYDADQQRLRCVSCPADGPATASASLVPDVTDTSPKLSPLGAVRPSFLATDGTVFFSTAGALVSQDTNGITDVYEFDPATDEVSLLTTGTGFDPAAFVEASASGDDVFVVTRQRLVKTDRDTLVDLYDVRVNGGFADPPDARTCVEDECQGAAVSAPGDPDIGSLEFEDGAGPAGRPGLRVLRARVAGRRALVRVAVPSRGTLKWAGSGTRRGTRRVSKRGVYRIQVALTAQAGRTLTRRGVVRTRLRLTFTPVRGNPSARGLSLRFKTSSIAKGR